MLSRRVATLVHAALPATARALIVSSDIQLTTPPEPTFGDLATNVAMVLAKKAGTAPRALAEEIVKNLDPTFVARAEVAGPGFLNLFLRPALFHAVLTDIEKAGADYGAIDVGHGVSALLEFISANPTGPLTIANGRGGFGGDVLARVLRRANFNVMTEYYINDAGNQIDILGRSIQSAVGHIPPTDELYQGAYIRELATAYPEKIQVDAYETGKTFAALLLEKEIKPAVARMHVEFDHWQSERELREEEGIEKLLAFLAEKGLSYEQDGAVYLATSRFGDDKDRVIVKSAAEGGGPTYALPDLMYHKNKFDRGHTKLIDILGADHHGYVPRLQIGVKMLGYGEVEVIITQLVKLFRGGVEVRMSKRAGNFELMDDLIQEVGADVARWFFVMRDWNTHLNFDLDLAKSQSADNPVFYVQYAHTRMAGILRQAEEKVANVDWRTGDLALLTAPAELALIRKLAELPALIAEVATTYGVHRLTTYARELAADFHTFYTVCRVLDEGNLPLSTARLRLTAITKEVFRIVLEDLVGVSAPEKM